MLFLLHIGATGALFQGFRLAKFCFFFVDSLWDGGRCKLRKKIVSSAWSCGKLIFMSRLKSGDLFMALEVVSGQCCLTCHMLSVWGEFFCPFLLVPQIIVFFCGVLSKFSSGIAWASWHLRYGGLWHGGVCLNVNVYPPSITYIVPHQCISEAFELPKC